MPCCIYPACSGNHLRCRFRQLLEDHGLGPKILELVNRHLAKYGIGVHRGTIVDAMLIEGPTSTKNQSHSCSPEMEGEFPAS